MKQILLFAFLWLALVLYCPAEAALAFPELDLTDTVGYWWMHNALETTVRAKMNEGFRIIRLDVRDVSPLRFTATFVANAGAYQRTGTDWQAGLTEAQVNQIDADKARRIVDISSYVEGSQVRYAVVWVGNTGAQAKSGSVIVAAPSLQAVKDKALSTGMRVVDLEVITGPTGTTYSAVLVEKEPGNDRCQIIGEGTIEDINDRVFKSETDGTSAEPCSGFQHRVIALEPAGGDHFLYIAESRMGNEKPWWFADLSYHGVNGAAAGSSDYIPDPTNLEQIDNLGVLADRLQGRVFDIKHYSVSGNDRYVALVTDNVQYPQRGPSPGADPALQAIDQAMLDAMKKWGVPGGTIAVTQGGRLVYAQAYGFSHVSRGADRQLRPATPDTLFRIASCSKSFTSLAIQKLIEQGHLTLDTTPFGQIFTQVPKDANLKKLTIRQILEHKSWYPDSLGWAASVTDWTNADPPAVYANRVDGSAYYQNSNYHLLTLVIEAVTQMTYEDYFRQSFLTPLGIQRMRISHLREEGFTDAPIIEAAGYSDITVHNRRNLDGTFNDPDSGDWITSPTTRVGASTWAVSPVDALRLVCSADGSLGDPRVLSSASFDRIITGARQGNGESTDAAADANTAMYVLGFSNDDVGGGKRALQHGGYLPGTTNAVISLRNDGIKFLISFNGDMANGYSALVEGKRVQTAGIAGDALGPLHQIFNTMTLPMQDHWTDFGFAPAKPVTGADCTGVLVWQAGTYTADDQVQVGGTLYRCKPFPFSGWCGQVGYKPGVDASWQEAWEVVDACSSGVVGGGVPTNNCLALPEWQQGTYSGGDVVQHGNSVYQCKGWPQSGWCGQNGYEPGVTLYWQDAWTSIGACA